VVSGADQTTNPKGSAGGQIFASTSGRSRTVAIAATMDTKGIYVDLLRVELERRGVAVVVIDCSMRPAGQHRVDIGADEIAVRGGSSLAQIRAHRDRAPALSAMLAGLEYCVAALAEEGRIGGFVGIGGGTNASLAARAFGVLPYGMPKVLVSTAVSGDTKPLIAGSDAVLIHPVVDFVGMNAPIRASLARAAGVMAEMLDIPFWDGDADRPVVGVTAVGATTPAADRAAAWLETNNFGSYVFHARGPGGMALEQMIAQGRLCAALDLTTTEATDEVLGGLRSAGPRRLEAAAQAGIAQIVAPGATDLVNFSAPDTVPDRFRDRQLAFHTPSSTLMRVLPEESREIGAWMGERLSRARGPTQVLVPMLGFSSYDRPGSDFENLEARQSFVDGISAALERRKDILVELLDLHINDPAFAHIACERLVDLMRPRH
jgi:uncharacterized protein (UPF0261 family)